ncbi:MAG TPA: hypothetical protein VEA44_01080 [Caulobacter sp.]|nr:hypothetical protein [Caulobacter sp.]
MKTLVRLALALTLAAAALAAQAQARPTPPSARPAVPPLSDCDAPASRAKIVAESEATLQSVQGYMESYAAYSDAQARWKSDQLVAKGAWTEAEAGAFGAEMLKDPTFAAMTKANMKAVEKLFDALKPFMDASAAKDELGICRSMIGFIAAAYAVVDTTEEQWRYMDERFAQVAKAKGVSLD